MASGDVLPRFFSVFLSQYSSTSLLIPSSYYEHLPRRLPKTAILMGTGGKSWKVAMKRKREQVYFEQGWDNFVADNDLKDGEFLSFVFDGYRHYEVSIYGHGGCKETRAAIEVEEISDGTESENSDSSLENVTQVEEINDDETKSDPDYSPDSLHITSISVESAEVFNTSSATSRIRAKTIENPEAYLDDPNNICFETSLKKRKCELIVPAQFVKDYCLKFGNVEYIDRFGNLTAKTTKWADQRMCIQSWRTICSRNSITKKDSILCELFRTSDKVFIQSKFTSSVMEHYSLSFSYAIRQIVVFFCSSMSNFKLVSVSLVYLNSFCIIRLGFCLLGFNSI